MPSYIIDNYNIYTTVSTDNIIIRIINYQDRVFQCELTHESCILTENIDELYTLIDDTFNKKYELKLSIDKSTLIVCIIIPLGFKSQEIKFYIPEIKKDFNYKDQQILEMTKMLSEFQNKLKMYDEIISKLNRKTNGHIILPECNIPIPSNIKKLCLITGKYINEDIKVRISPQPNVDIWKEKFAYNPYIDNDDIQYLIFNGSDINNLEFLENLETLIIKNNNFIVNFSVIKKLSTLKNLEINNCDNCDNISFVKSLINLENISFINCKNLKDINILADLSNLKTIRLNNSGVVNTTMLINPNFTIYK